MKRKLFFAVLAAVVLASCNESVCVEPEDESGLVKLNLSVPVGQTKSAGTEDERNVYNLQVFLFDDNGALEAYDYVKNQLSTSLECTPGIKKIVAITNAPDLKDVKSFEDLNGRTSNMKDNSLRNFIMSGSVQEDITASADISIPVTRLAAKITIASITNNMALDYHKNLNFKVSDMYLINVPGSTGYLEEKTPELWYNMMKVGGAADVLLLVSRHKSDQITVPYGEAKQVGEVFYSYPNGTQTDTSDPEWCPRYTRFVVEAWLGNDRYYYPVSIPNIERNTAYEIHLTVTRPGSSSPDALIDLEAASVSINIVDWVDTEDINEKI